MTKEAPDFIRRHAPPSKSNRIALAVAADSDRKQIYALRHAIYAMELGQHAGNPEGRLTDALDASNIYLAAKSGTDVAGFISITPPGRHGYSIDKYFSRASLPFQFDRHLFEIRLLTVREENRRTDLALLLMYAAFRWIEAHGGKRIMAIGRREIVEMYLKGGLEPVGLSVKSGNVTFDVLQAPIEAIRDRVASFSGLLSRLEEKVDWRLNFPFRQPARCFHGGAFFDAIGEDFSSMERHRKIINADVLDAWFAPAPGVLAALQEHLPWLIRTSPPTDCQGLVQTVAATRGVDSQNILPGAGSSDLIFRAFTRWLTPASNVLILDPTYGEYAHVLERVIGCTTDRVGLTRQSHYDVDLDRLEAALADHYDLIVLVNPNSPTGRHLGRERLQEFLSRVPMDTRVWIDETYIDYAGAGQTLEQFAAQSENVIVCKSMSKVYALSGARAAYLCAGPHQLEELRSITPPWVVGLPTQVAAVRALQDPDYYAARYSETARLRQDLVGELKKLQWEIVPGVANFLLCHLPPDGPDAASLVKHCRAHGLYLRDAGPMGSQLGTHALRIAVKDAATNARMMDILHQVLT